MEAELMIAIAIVGILLIITVALYRKVGADRRRERELVSRRIQAADEHEAAAHQRLQAAEAAVRMDRSEDPVHEGRKGSRFTREEQVADERVPDEPRRGQ